LFGQKVVYFQKNTTKMKTLAFKTNIKCNGCVAKVTPVLQNASGIANWEVNTASPDKVLTIQTEQLTPQEIQALVQQAGFTAQPVAS
jgi:copper chaperone